MKKSGLLLMFIGAVMIAILMFAKLPIDFGLWIVLYLIGMVVAGSGIVVLLIYLAKGIKADKVKKNDLN